MPNDAISARAVCPYYVRAEKNHITCDGVVDQATTSLVFVEVQLMRDYADVYCCRFAFRRCPVYRMLAAAEEKDGE